MKFLNEPNGLRNSSMRRLSMYRPPSSIRRLIGARTSSKSAPSRRPSKRSGSSERPPAFPPGSDAW
ncbi:Uncharacterised protein [Bordetella pertussis]|nr:Uncharacterised protein [Bordetella pertussis]